MARNGRATWTASQSGEYFESWSSRALIGLFTTHFFDPASGTYGEVRACAGIVSHADLMLGDRVAETLEAHIAAAPGRFRGIRHGSAWDADAKVLGPLQRRTEGLMMNGTFREGFARLAPLGLSFDAWLLEPQLGEVIDFTRAAPYAGLTGMPAWPPPEVPSALTLTNPTVAPGQIGNLGLTPQEEADVVAFLRTLSDAP